MTETTLSPAGIFGTLRQLLNTGLAIVQNRLELVELELREEKNRAVAVLVWAGLLILTTFLAMVTITFLAVVIFWEQAPWVLLGFSVFYLISGLVAGLAIRSRLKKPAFAETINQIKKDREWLFPKK